MGLRGTRAMPRGLQARLPWATGLCQPLRGPAAASPEAVSKERFWPRGPLRTERRENTPGRQSLPETSAPPARAGAARPGPGQGRHRSGSVLLPALGPGSARGLRCPPAPGRSAAGAGTAASRCLPLPPGRQPLRSLFPVAEGSGERAARCFCSSPFPLPEGCLLPFPSPAPACFSCGLKTKRRVFGSSRRAPAPAAVPAVRADGTRGSPGTAGSRRLFTGHAGTGVLVRKPFHVSKPCVCARTLDPRGGNRILRVQNQWALGH